MLQRRRSTSISSNATIPSASTACAWSAKSEESKTLNDLKEPAVIIAASGMCESGRILHHLRNNIENPNTTVLFVGYCAEHTLGWKLRNGVEERQHPRR